MVRTLKKTQALAFSGIHVISPRLLPLMKEDGVFSIIDCYLRLAGGGEKIAAFRADEYYWRDLGKPADLEQAARDMKQRSFPKLLCHSGNRTKQLAAESSRSDQQKKLNGKRERVQQAPAIASLHREARGEPWRFFDFRAWD